MRLAISIFLFCVFFTFSGKIFAQQDDISIANEYFRTGEYEKAFVKYEDLSKKPKLIPVIYGNYLSTLKYLDKSKEAEKFVKTTIKTFPDNPLYKADLYIIMAEQKDSKTDKYFKSLVNDIKTDRVVVSSIQEYLVKNGYTDAAVELLLEARKASPQKNDYAIYLAKVYMLQDKKEAMMDEMIIHLMENDYQLETVKNNFQNYLQEKEDYQLLEDKLYQLIQKNPDKIVLNELLLWLNIQNKDFRQALLQAKAIDRKSNLGGAKLLEVGKIALDNKKYDAAEKFFESVLDRIHSGYNYSVARRLLIFSKEEAVKNSYPLDTAKIFSLINDYKKLINDLGRNKQAYEAMKNMALLYGIYLDKKDTATILLQEILNEPAADYRLKAETKISLADIYLLSSEPWEASLLYSQVEKDMKEDKLGHEAKLKNAKLAYYKGEFDLAQAHLDILKMATTREIANDAMDLSILIQDNSALDTSYAALMQYAEIDLLLFQKKDEQALSQMDSLLLKYPGHSLTDEIYWLQAEVYRKRANYDQAMAKLEKIVREYPEGIYADDAMFTKAQILEQNLNRKEDAMDIYKEFLYTYPGSIYVAEARKRYRLLRGDKL